MFWKTKIAIREEHVCFAWRPVYTKNGYTVWLQKVKRRYRKDEWNYKLIQNPQEMHKWFAWRPVKVDGKWVFLKTIHRSHDGKEWKYLEIIEVEVEIEENIDRPKE